MLASIRLTAVLLVLAYLSCVTGTEPGEAVHPLPVLVATRPPSLVVDSPDPTVAIVGEDFVPLTEALWNGAPRPTAFVSGTLVVLTLTPADLSAPSSATVQVTTPGPGGGASQTLGFAVTSPVPSIDSIAPGSAQALLSHSVALSVFGAGFTAFGRGSVVLFDGAPIPTSVVSSSEALATVPDYLLRLGDSVAIRVLNPEPGGALSAPARFTVLNPPPALTTVLPDSIRLGEPAEVILLGTGFVPGSTVRIGPLTYTPDFVEEDSIRVLVRASWLTRDGRVAVESPGPGGGSSNEAIIAIQEREPFVATLYPTALEEGGGDQEVRVMGWDFAPDAVVHWNGVPMATTYLGGGDTVQYRPPDTLVAAIPASASGAWGPAYVHVENPRGGGPSPTVQTAVVPLGTLAVSDLEGISVSGLGGARHVDLPPAPRGLHPPSLEPWPHGADLLLASDVLPSLLRVSPSGSTTTLLAEEVAFPRIASDSAWVYYTPSAFGVAPTVWRLSPNGGSPEWVLDGGVAADPSPTGDSISFIAIPPTGPSELTVLDLTTNAATPLGVDALDARWSPDGQWIAYVPGATPGARHGTLRLIRPDGTGDTALDDTHNRYRAGTFDWSPDGRFILGAHGVSLSVIEVGTGSAVIYPAPTPWDPIFTDSRQVAWFPDP